MDNTFPDHFSLKNNCGAVKWWQGKMRKGKIIWLSPWNSGGIRACDRRNKRAFHIGDIF